jgi:uncharacterized repeat protein (TIGR03809 family)
MFRTGEDWDWSETARRCRDLAERRRVYLIELYRSGRWRRYYSEQDFLAFVRGVAADIEFWDGLAGPETLLLRKAG